MFPYNEFRGSPSLSDQREVYLALRECMQFTRPDRPRFWVKDIVKRNRERDNVAPLLRSLGKERVVNAAWYLLGQGIFASEKKAQKRFPGLVLTPPGSQGQKFQAWGDAGVRYFDEVVFADRKPPNPIAGPPWGLFAPPSSQTRGSQVSEGILPSECGGMSSFCQKSTDSVANPSGGLFGAPPGGDARRPSFLNSGEPQRQDKEQSQQIFAGPPAETVTGFGNAMKAPAVLQQTPRPASTPRTPTVLATSSPLLGTARPASTPRTPAVLATSNPFSGTARPAATSGTSTVLATSKPASATSKPGPAASKPVPTLKNSTVLAPALAEPTLQTSTARVPAHSKETTATSSEQAKHSIKVPSLFPIYLPRKAQHFLLVHLQKVLEQACFDFGKQTFPEILAENKWECAESVELNRWTELLASRHEFFGPESKLLSFRWPTELFTSVASIRHAAVERHNVTAADLQERIATAADLLSLLKDAPRVTELRKLQRSVQATIDKLQRNKRILTKNMKVTVRDAASKREEADRMEQQAAEHMKKRDGEYQEKAGLDLEQAILFAQHAAAGGADASISGMGGG
ncbi:hypothetical protein TOPH_08582 [Tolypocladium ophioglossoides CBS 100239]|uniref:Uncharacterized protein n=1 Tax=Tolypocladium ophioglossoides (strain CBS 100239) TaxID=1163406 RepID=A0A0L0MXZ8_TOLOC|nr:hypothetical protein TOPH_08582 [Tolypocladium ophioglossoides CBS 100239]